MKKAATFKAPTGINDDGTIVGAAQLADRSGINNAGQIAASGCQAGLCYAPRLDPI